MKHVDINKINQENRIDEQEIREGLTIVKHKKPYTIEDYLPKYSYDYDLVKVDNEYKSMIDDLHAFIRNNYRLAIDDYSCKDKEAIIEGFSRALALVELYIKTMYIEE